MSWIDTLHNLTNNVGRGALDLFTVGGNELGHQFGGQGYKNFLKPIETGMGANFEAGATGGSAMLGAQGMGAFAGTPTAGVNGMTTASGATGMGQGTGTVSKVMQAMRMMPQGGAPQQPSQDQTLSRIYQMFPSLRPGSQFGQGPNVGGM